MQEWGLITSIITASNNGDQAEVANIIEKHDFSKKIQAQSSALISFKLTKENIRQHIVAANKLAFLVPQSEWGITAQYRQIIFKCQIEAFGSNHESTSKVTPE